MRLFAKNLRTFFLALALGVSVWLSAVSAADPNEVRAYPRPIPLEVIGQDPSLVLTTDIPSSVEVTLRAPRSVWESLTAREDAIRATLDLSGLSAGEHTQQIQLTISERPYQLIRMNPVTASVNLESLINRTLPLVVSLNGQPAAGYQAGDATRNVTEVTISGPESLVRQVERARVLINLDGARESVDEELPIELVDPENNRIQGLTIHPESVRVNIPISQQGGFRDMAVKVVVQGQQAPGYRIENISVFPPVITIFSENPELVNELPGVVETLPLDLQDRNEDISTRLSLVLPDNVTLVGPQTVQVNVSISPIQTSVTLPNLPIDVIGVAEGLSAQVFPQGVDVILSGPVPVLEAISSQDITVSVDVTGLDIGVYQLEPDVDILVENVSEESILPGTVEVVIAVPSTPTPTAFPP
ncbi:MAG TPA: CdaR family protein [Anaerolineales bacterium]|jgi:YbbR domain-containing protein|nr:CdaR family protein [Anaerolineales bacterium]